MYVISIELKESSLNIPLFCAFLPFNDHCSIALHAIFFAMHALNIKNTISTNYMSYIANEIVIKTFITASEICNKFFCSY